MVSLRDISNFQANTAATPSGVMEAELALGVSLPKDYVAFLQSMDGGEGFVGEQYVVFWRCSELAEFNAEYETDKYAPWAVFFGSNGGGEGFAFDKECEPWRVVLVPFIGMEKRTALDYGACFDDFLYNLVSGFDPFGPSNR